MKSRARFGAAFLGILATTLGLSACAEKEERGYEIPSSLCGTAIQAETLKPLMPPGKEMNTETSSLVEGVKRCRVFVDGDQVLSASIDWREEGQSLTDAASLVPGVDPGDKETDDGHYLYSAFGAIGEVACPNPRKPDRKLFVTALSREDEAPGEAAMKEFIAAYAETVAKSDECT
ncbi:hypothetical protein F0L17_03205 [Streptomyces sp. TRM43335]|uniref:DUF3558 domain-containing protein n=1 Tax=Streptomyces taklimakanensis TaxID=2569853 RepID=A0A6G2B7U9_9ACTN|nr:hypothetical protein [Streptomyces taklimakanensis]MTE18153.1 hypothetical protein [Streptomyces taklimakanensis]